MASIPKWFAQLNWSHVWSVAELSLNRNSIPDISGCYIFTADASGLRPNRVLYVGKATNLRQRLGGYLVDYMNTTTTDHKGRAFIFEHRSKVGDHKTFVRWVEYGGKPEELEANLCEFLWPDCTDRWETSHELWNRNQRIDPRLLG
jgi:hypothetical protein